MSVPLYQEVAYHILAGVSLALGDRYFSGNAQRKTEQRVARKMTALESLEYLAGLSNPQVDTLRPEPAFRQHMSNARDYFLSRGIAIKSLDDSQGTVSLLIDRLRRYRSVERINPISLRNKLGVAFGLEFIMDSFAVVNQALGGSSNALAAFAKTTYQAPALFVGFTLAKGILTVKDSLTRSKDEKDMDKLGYELTQDGKVLALAQAYYKTPAPLPQPAQATSTTPASDAEASSPTEKGSLVDTVTSTVAAAGQSLLGRLGDLKRKITAGSAERAAKEQALRDKVKKKLDNY